MPGAGCDTEGRSILSVVKASNFCRFMSEYDDRLELAPRDIVARAIQDQMLMHDDPNVLLDISHCQRDHILTHFPNIAQQCLKHGVDITRDPIPVAPAAHFMCGGVSVCHCP